MRGQRDHLLVAVVAAGRGGQVVELGLAGDTAEGVVGGFPHLAGDPAGGLRMVQRQQGALFAQRAIEPVMVGAGDHVVDVGRLGVPQRALVFRDRAIAIGAGGGVLGLVRRHGLGAQPVDGIIAKAGFHAVGVLRFDELIAQGAVQAAGGSFERAAMGLEGGGGAQVGRLVGGILALLIVPFGTRLGLAQLGRLVVGTPMQEHVIGHVQVGDILAAQQLFAALEDLELLYAIGHQPGVGLLPCARCTQHGQRAVGVARTQDLGRGRALGRVNGEALEVALEAIRVGWAALGATGRVEFADHGRAIGELFAHQVAVGVIFGEHRFVAVILGAGLRPGRGYFAGQLHPHFLGVEVARPVVILGSDGLDAAGLVSDLFGEQVEPVEAVLDGLQHLASQVVADLGLVVEGAAGELVELVLVVAFIPDHTGGAIAEEVFFAVFVGGLDRVGVVQRVGDFLVLDHIRQVLAQPRVLMAGLLVEDAFNATERSGEALKKAHASKLLVSECPVGQVAGRHHQRTQFFAFELQGELLVGFSVGVNMQ
ncbi:hypothetical protein D3C80_909150 [compost metagenome]